MSEQRRPCQVCGGRMLDHHWTVIDDVVTFACPDPKAPEFDTYRTNPADESKGNRD